MDAMYNALEIALEEAENLNPCLKLASVGVGSLKAYKQIKKVIQPLKGATSLGIDFVTKFYDIFRNKLNWGLSDIRNNFTFLGKHLGTKLKNVNAADFFNLLKEQFGETFAFLNTNQGNNTPVFKIGNLPGTNSCIFMEMYPNASSGFNWTIEFSTGPCNATNASQLNTKFKVRFDN